MLTPEERSIDGLLRGCAAADEVLADLAATADFDVWTGPAAATYLSVLETRTAPVRRALVRAREAAAALTARLPPGGG